MNCIIYCRVSTREQVENGLSLITQQKMCEDYADKNNLNIHTTPFIEKGESAKTLERTELKKMMDYVAKNKNDIGLLIIYRIDRLSRQTVDYQTIKILLKKYGVSIHSLSERIEDSPSGRMFETIMSASAQWDNEVRGERARNGTIEALKQGRWVYQAPYGYIQTGGRGKANIIRDNEKASIVTKIFKYLSEGGNTIEDARRYAFTLGMRSTNGKRYPKGSFHRLVRRPIYKGFICIPKMGLYQRGSFEAIISPKIFDMVQKIIDRKNYNPPIYRKIHPDFPLRGTILCPHCEKKMTANWSKGKYPYYKCSHCKNTNLNRDKVHNDFKQYLTSLEISKKVTELTKEAVKLSWKERKENSTRQINALKKQQEQITQEEEAVSKQHRDGILPGRFAKEQINRLEEEYIQIGLELSEYQLPEEQEEELLEYATKFLTDIYSTWEGLDVQSQNELQKFLFPDGLQYEGEKFATNKESILGDMRDYITIREVSNGEPPEKVLQLIIEKLLSLGSLLKRLNITHKDLVINTV